MNADVPADRESAESDGPFETDSIRSFLTGGAAAVLATVVEVHGDTLRVVIDEVFTDGLDALTATDCTTFEAGDQLIVENTTSRFRNDLLVDDQALVIGDPCADHQGTIWLPPNGPNARKIINGSVDLGGGDLVTLDEARKLAGADWQPQPPLVDPPTVDARRTGDQLTLTVTGTFDGRIGTATCPHGAITPASGSADIMGPCNVMDPTSRDDQGAPTLTKGGTIELAYDLGTALIETPDTDLVVFGDDGTQMHVIAVQPIPQG